MNADTNATVIKNVRVFDGRRLSDERTVTVEGGIITDNAHSNALTVDGQGGTLLPGLIDSHVHLTAIDNLEQGVKWGVTTMLDMGSPSMALTDSFRHRAGLTDVLGCGNSASAPGGMQTTYMGFPASSAVTGPSDAARFVAERVAEGGDYIKIIVEDPKVMGPAALDGATIAALVAAAHDANLKTIAHASSLAAFQLAEDGGVDVITHAPLDADAGQERVASLVARGVVSIPTLTMMKRIVANASNLPTHARHLDYTHALATVASFHSAGLQILAGTDANMAPMSPAKVPHGESLHDELALLVDAGLTPVEALRAATVLPARYFGLTDRGAIEPGLRADLVLVAGDPTVDIAATRALQGVWVGGIQARR